jgi:uncharacterized membrane protein
MAINAIYRAPDSEEALSLLRKYNVEYIYVGSIERNGTSGQKGYLAESLQKFSSDSERYKPIYEKDGVTIYQVLS